MAKSVLILRSAANDPGEIYRYRAKKLAGSSDNWQTFFAYEIFGPELMGSIALALDPYSKVRFPWEIISPKNRLTYFASIPPTSRVRYEHRVVRLTWNDPDGSVQNCGLVGRSPIRTSEYIDSVQSLALTGQVGYRGFRHDTTRRTRSLGARGGELELFVPTWHAPARNNSWYTQTKSRVYDDVYGPCATQVNDSHFTRFIQIRGASATISTASLDQILAEERSNADLKRQKFGLALVEECLPKSRKFDLTYNLAELKDLPLMMRSTVELARLTRPPTLKQAGSQYLNWEFGWKATLDAVKDMLELPATIAKHVNYLLRRRGLPTTFRSQRKGLEAITSIPSVTNTFGTGETFLSGGYKKSREYELRCVLNLTLDFPDIAVPVLRRDLIYAKWGTSLNPADVYNLVPWTWLVDWFSGLDDYIRILDTVRGDRSLFNYGYLTYCSKGEVVASVKVRTTNTENVVITPGPDSSKTIFKVQNIGQALRYRYQKRTDISSLSGVKAVSNPTSLSGDQLAIIGALLTKWANR